jgi:hypothetical protein
VGRWCGARGGEAGGGRWPEMAACMEALAKELVVQRTTVPRASRGGRVGRGPRTAVVVSKKSQNSGGGVKEGSWWRWSQRGVPTEVAAACEGNKKL